MTRDYNHGTEQQAPHQISADNDCNSLCIFSKLANRVVIEGDLSWHSDHCYRLLAERFVKEASGGIL